MPAVIDGTTGIDTVQDNVITTADLQNGAVTGAKLSGAQTGGAPVYGCRAWCVFDGTLVGTNAPTAGGNVANVTRNGTGDYTVNFTTAMPDTNFAVFGNAYWTTAGGSQCIVAVKSVASPKTGTSVNIQTVRSDTAAAVDFSEVYVAIFR